MTRLTFSAFALYLTLISFSCSPKVDSISLSEEKRMADMWYQGKAHILSYELTQNRYQDVHPGYAVLIQVTEDFDKVRQVKSQKELNPNAVGVLKSNLIHRFTTGLYDYNIMTSTFTPTTEKDETLKVSMSSQDWCGQSFMQINRQAKDYSYNSFSYFETEGDETGSLSHVLLEDALFNLIRIHGANLDVTVDSILPAARILRMMHLPAQPIACSVSLVSDELSHILNVEMPSINRKLNVTFDSQPPHTIQGWTDSYPSAFDQQIRKTEAVLVHDEWSQYWEQNKANDRALRNLWSLPNHRLNQVIQPTMN